MKLTASLFVISLGALVTVAGCGKRPFASKPNVVAPAAPERGFVDVRRLAARHPLQADVRRLAAAERRLGLLALTRQASGTAGSGAAAGYVLPALPVGGGDGATARAAFARRRANARLQLVRDTDQQLGALARELDDRRERRRAQRRAALEAVGRAQQQEQERLIREGVTIRVRALLEAQSLKRVNLRVKRNTLDSDLALDWVLGSADLEAEIKRLQTEPAATGISDRARLERARRQVEADLVSRSGEADAVQRAGVRDAAIAITEARAQAAEKIEQQLALELNGDRAQELIGGQRKERANALAREAQVSARALAEANALRRAQASGGVAGAFTVATWAPQAGALPLGDAVRRIAAQRRRLLAFIATDIREAVRDAAQTHHVVVELRENGETAGTSGRPSPGEIGKKASLTDLTDRFAGWVLPEAMRGATAATREAGG